MDRWLRRLPLILLAVAMGLATWLALDVAVGFRAERSASGFGAAEVFTTTTTTSVPTTTTTTMVATTTTTTNPATTTTTTPWPESCREALVALARDGGTLAESMRHLTSLVAAAEAGEGGWDGAADYVTGDLRYWLGVLLTDVERSLESTTRLDDPTQWYTALDWQGYGQRVGSALAEFQRMTVDGAPEPEAWEQWTASWQSLREEYATVSGRASDSTHCRD